MTLILPERIPELVLVTIDVLCPILAVFSAIYPPFVILRFNYKDAIDGDDHMVNL